MPASSPPACSLNQTRTDSGIPSDSFRWETALARAFRWRRLLEDGVYATIEELAAAERINSSYVSRVLRLTLLAPDIVQAILDGRQVPALAMARLTRPFPVLWEEQVCLVASGVP